MDQLILLLLQVQVMIQVMNQDGMMRKNGDLILLFRLMYQIQINVQANGEKYTDTSQSKYKDEFIRSIILF